MSSRAFPVVPIMVGFANCLYVWLYLGFIQFWGTCFEKTKWVANRLLDTNIVKHQQSNKTARCLNKTPGVFSYIKSNAINLMLVSKSQHINVFQYPVTLTAFHQSAVHTQTFGSPMTRFYMAEASPACWTSVGGTGASRFEWRGSWCLPWALWEVKHGNFGPLYSFFFGGVL